MDQEIIDVQEVFNIQPKTGPNSSKEELQIHILNCHAVILGLNVFVQKKGLSGEFLEWCKLHLKMISSFEEANDRWGVLNN